MWRRILTLGLAGFLLLLGSQSSNSSLPLTNQQVSAQGIVEERPAREAGLGTAFTFQGGLSTAAGPITGACDLRFGLFDAASGGSQIGNATRASTPVTGGLFAVSLDFGSEAFNGNDRFLETAVRCPAGSGAYVTLAPRQQVAPAPYALIAESASSSRADFTVNGKLWVTESASFGGPSTMGAIALRSPDLWIQADSSFGRGDGGRALAHTENDTLDINHQGDFAGGVVVGSNTTVDGNLDVQGFAVLGATDSLTAASFRAPDVYLNADSSFGRGAGGRALAHDYGDILSINHLGDFDGGVKIWGETTIQGWKMQLNGIDFVINGGGTRGDGGRALVHADNDTLVINMANDFGGGVEIASPARVDGSLTVMGDLTAEGNAIRLLGTDLFISAGGSRGDGGRAMVHHTQDTLVINYDRDFAGGVRINDLRTGKIVEENLMTPAQQEDFSLLPFTQGDVLCWDGDRQELVRCAGFASPLVVGVADEQGKPIVLGAELIKVIGSVQPGDLLVASDAAGYATAWSRLKPGSPPAGVVIAKALQRFDGAEGTIKAMIFLQ